MSVFFKKELGSRKLKTSGPEGTLDRRSVLLTSSLAAVGAGATSLLSASHAVADVTNPSPASTSASAKGAIMLSMDDAYLSMDTVRRYLDARGQKGTFFITPGLLGGSSKIDTSHILAMVSSGHEVAAHSQTHPNFTAISQAQRILELEQPKTFLENLIGARVTSFAYPFGTASGGRSAATDVELYLRYDRIFDTAQYNQTSIYPRYAQAPALIRRTCVDGSNHQQCLAMIREAATRPVIASFYFHNLDTPINPTTAQLTEMLDLAKSLGVELVTASDAFGTHRMVVNAGFEDSGSDPYPWRWFRSGAALLEIVSEVPAEGLPGGKSLHLTAPKSTYSQAVQAVEVTPGVPYTFSFRARAVSGPVWQANCAYGSVTGLDYGQNQISGSQVRTASIMADNTAWSKYSVDFTPTASCTTVLLGLVIDSPWNGGRVAFDHVWFAPKSMPDLG